MRKVKGLDNLRNIYYVTYIFSLVCNEISRKSRSFYEERFSRNES